MSVESGVHTDLHIIHAAHLEGERKYNHSFDAMFNYVLKPVWFTQSVVGTMKQTRPRLRLSLLFNYKAKAQGRLSMECALAQ